MSFRKQLEKNGGVPEFVDFVGKHNIWKAMEKYHIGYMPAKKVLMDEGCSDTFGLGGAGDNYGFKTMRELLREMVIAFGDRLIKSDREKQQLQAEMRLYLADRERQALDMRSDVIDFVRELSAPIEACEDEI